MEVCGSGVRLVQQHLNEFHQVLCLSMQTSTPGLFSPSFIYLSGHLIYCNYYFQLHLRFHSRALSVRLCCLRQSANTFFFKKILNVKNEAVDCCGGSFSRRQMTARDVRMHGEGRGQIRQQINHGAYLAMPQDVVNVLISKTVSSRRMSS